VVGVLEVDGEPAVDEHAAEFAFGALGVDARGAADVPGADGDRALAVEVGVAEGVSRGVDARCRRGDLLAGAVGVREAAEPLAVHVAGDGDGGRDDADVGGGSRGFGGGERVVVTAEFEDVHAHRSTPAANQATDGGRGYLSGRHRDYQPL